MNVVLFMSDTFRCDNVSCYGPTSARTPRLDGFAREAFIFTNAYCGSFPTMPNRLDIMSGKFSFATHEWCPLPKEIVTLQQVLSASGVVTQLIVDNPHMIEMGFNYERGFDGWEWIRGQETDKWKTAPKEVELPYDSKKTRSRDFLVKQHLRNTHWWKSEEDRFVARTVQAACEWLEENQDQDTFFLWVDAFDPHEPWDAPQKYIDLYDTTYDGEEIFYPHYHFWQEFLTERELRRARALYRAEVTMVDHWFGVLLDKLEELGLADDTAVIFTSDHGFLLGEHGIIGKAIMNEVEGGGFVYEATPMYAELRRIPLLVRLPGVEQTRRIDALVQAPDLFPTILEMAGLVTTEVVSGQVLTQALQCGMFFAEDWRLDLSCIHGRSLMPLMRGETERLRDIAVCSNTLLHHTPILAKCAIVTEDGWCLHYAGKYHQMPEGGAMYTLKLIDSDKARLSTKPSLYNLRSDPGETRDVMEENHALAREIHERYVRWLEEIGTPPEHLAGRRQFL